MATIDEILSNRDDNPRYLFVMPNVGVSGSISIQWLDQKWSATVTDADNSYTGTSESYVGAVIVAMAKRLGLNAVVTDQ